MQRSLSSVLKTEHLSDVQFGFRKGKGCTDTIFAPRQLYEREMEHDEVLHPVFVDQEKSFDWVNWGRRWEVLDQNKVKGQLLDNNRAMYTNSMSAVCKASETSDWFPVASSVRQGWKLSPLLFCVLHEPVVNGPESLNELMFADN